MSLLTFSGLGTSWWIEIFDNCTNERRTSIQHSVTALVRTFEARYSRFRADSLISQLNTNRTLPNPDPALIALLTTGQSLARLTRGTFNFLLGDHLSARGYDSSYSFTATTAPSTIANPLTDITITDTAVTITAGSIDLGGYGKGYLVDLIATHLHGEYSLQSFLINGGGDMYGTSDHGHPVTLHLEHPLEPKSLGTTTLHHQGFAASSPHKRQWKTAAGTTNHIVSTDLLTADASFILAPSATLADALATTSLIMPPADFGTLCQAENVAVALYHTATRQLQRSHTFPFTPAT